MKKRRGISVENPGLCDGKFPPTLSSLDGERIFLDGSLRPNENRKATVVLIGGFNLM